MRNSEKIGHIVLGTVRHLVYVQKGKQNIVNKYTNNVYLASKTVDFSGDTSLLNRYIPDRFYSPSPQLNIYGITHQRVS